MKLALAKDKRNSITGVTFLPALLFTLTTVVNSSAEAGWASWFTKSPVDTKCVTALGATDATRPSNSSSSTTLRAFQAESARTHTLLNQFLEGQLNGISLDFHRMEIAAQAKLAAGDKPGYDHAMAELASKYEANGRLQEAAWTYATIGNQAKAAELKAKLDSILRNSPVRFMKRIDTENYAYNGKQKGKTESWLVELDGGILGIFKPDTPYWEDVAAGAKRQAKFNESQIAEEIAMIDDDVLGTNLVGMTVTRDGLVAPSGKMKSGSLQYFFRDKFNEHGYAIAESIWPGQTFLETWSSGGQTEQKRVPVWRKLRTGNMMFFDYITDNKDRHADNMLYLAGGRRVGVDHAASHGGKGIRWALHPTLENIHEFVPDDPAVLEKAKTQSDADFAAELRARRYLPEAEIANMVARRRKLLTLMEKAGFI